jgi:hypothetical protein
MALKKENAPLHSTKDSPARQKGEFTALIIKNTPKIFGVF